MKKFLTAFLALSLVISMSAVAFAAEGDLYVKEDGDMCIETDTCLTPGKTYYVYICDGDVDEKPASKAYVKYECESFETDKKFSIMSSSLPIKKRRLASGDRAYFAEMELKEIPTSKYYEDGYSLEFTKFEEKKQIGGNVGSIVDEDYTVEYPEGSDITEDLQFFELEDTDDWYSVDNTDAEVLIDSTGVKTKALISCKTDYDMNYGEKYYNANLEFYYFNGVRLRRPATVTIPADDSRRYLYEITSSGLKRITKKNNGNFEFKTVTLGKYIVSDKMLSSVEINDTPTVEPSTPTYTPTPEPVPATLPNLPGAPTGGYVPYNPGTGAIV